MRAFVLLLFFAFRGLAQDSAEELLAAADRALNRGDYPTVMANAETAGKLFTAAKQRDRFGAAENLIGAAHLFRGEYAAALPHFQVALQIAKETKDFAAATRRLNNIGNAHFYMGQYAASFAEYSEARKLLRGQESQPWYARNYQLTLTNIAVLYQQLGQHQLALDLYREIQAQPGQLAANVQAQVLTNLAILYRRLGDPVKALENYRTAQVLLEKDPNSAASLYVLHNIGVLQALDGNDLPGALATFTKALALASRTGSRREAVLEHLFLGETLFRLGRAPAATAEFRVALAAAEGLKLPDERWTALYGLGRAQAISDPAAAGRSLRLAVEVIESTRSTIAGNSLKAEFLANKRDVYDALIGMVLNENAPAPSTIFELLEQSRSRNLKDRLPVEAPPRTLTEVSQRLVPGTMLLEYWLTRDRLAVVWATGQGFGLLQSAVSAAQREALAALPLSLARRDDPVWAGLADSVAGLLLPEGLPWSAGPIDTVIVVPDGQQQLIPMEVLPLRSGGRMIERFAVSYLPSAHFWGRATGTKGRRWPWQTQLLGFADPVPPPPSALEPPWPRLPFSAEEVRAVAAALPGGAELHLGADNRKAYLLAGSFPPVVHLATHAFIDNQDSRRSRLIFSPVTGEAASPYLSASEIAGLSLRGVELVTLAACETAQGRFLPGEGIDSFSRAFLAAGAGATVSSLWKVPDQSTAAFMERFYGHLAAGDSKTDALRRAKLSLLQSAGSTKHPYYWSAFVLYGAGETPLAPVFPWWPFAVVGLALAGIIYFRNLFRR